MSFGEIIFIIFVAILIFGPDKIPEIARGLGNGIRTMKNATEDIKNEIMSQVDDNEHIKEIEEEINKAKDALDELEGPIKRK